MANEYVQPDKFEHDEWELMRTCKDFINDYGEDVYYACLHAPRLYDKIKRLEEQIYILKTSASIKEHDDYASY